MSDSWLYVAVGAGLFYSTVRSELGVQASRLQMPWALYSVSIALQFVVVWASQDRDALFFFGGLPWIPLALSAYLLSQALLSRVR